MEVWHKTYRKKACFLKCWLLLAIADYDALILAAYMIS